MSRNTAFLLAFNDGYYHKYKVVLIKRITIFWEILGVIY